MSEPRTAAGDALLTDLIQDHEGPSYHVIERVRRGVLAIEAEARAEALRLLRCPDCHHRLTDHTPGGMCVGAGRPCHCVRFPEPEAWDADWDAIASIPAEPEQGDPWNGHEWMQREQDYYAFCRVCGTVRRADDKNKPCKGPVRIGLRAEPEQADEVAGLGAERIEAVLRAHQWRSMTFSCSCGLVFATGHIEHVAALIARLAPARDDTSGGAS